MAHFAKSKYIKDTIPDPEVPILPILGNKPDRIVLCDFCEIHKKAKNIKVGPRGWDYDLGIPSDNTIMTSTILPESVDVMFVGEGPGPKEDQYGMPFVGPAGLKLNDLIRESGLETSRILFTNLVRCFPQKDGKIRAPSNEEMFNCAPYLYAEINEHRPKVIVTLGNIPTGYLLETKEGITKIRGKWGKINVGEVSYPVMPTIHPAALLYQHTGEFRKGNFSDSDLVADLKAVHSYLNGSVNQLDFFRRSFLGTVDKVEEWVNSTIALYNDKQLDMEGIDFDCETEGLDPFKEDKKLLIIGLSRGFREGAGIPWDHPEFVWDVNDKYRVAQLIHKLFSAIPCSGHNIGFDIKWVSQKVFIDVLGMSVSESLKVFKIECDTEAAHRFFYVDLRSHGLKSIASRELGIPHYDSGLDKEDLKSAPLNDVYMYVVNDAIITRRVRNIIVKRLIDRGDYNHYRNLTLEPLATLIWMESEGAYVDLSSAGEIGQQLQKAMDGVCKWIAEQPIVIDWLMCKGCDGIGCGSCKGTGKQFEWDLTAMNSPDKLQELLYDVLQMPTPMLKDVQILTGKGEPSTNIEALDSLVDQCIELGRKYALEFVTRIIQYRKLAKIYNSYVKKLSTYARKGSLVHSHFHIGGTVSGRLSSTDPSFHTIPWESPVKKMFPSRWHDTGGIVTHMDYSQLELRIMAAVSKDPNFCSMFIPKTKEELEAGYRDYIKRYESTPEGPNKPPKAWSYEDYCDKSSDVHLANAALIYQTPKELVPETMRRHAKTLVFGVPYGRGWWSIAADTGVPDNEAKEFIKQFWKAYSVLKSKVYEVYNSIHETGYIRTPLGRYRPVLDGLIKLTPCPDHGTRRWDGWKSCMYCRDYQMGNNRVSRAEREGFNSLIQGTGSDIGLLACSRLYRRFSALNSRVNIITFTHDAIDADVGPMELFRTWSIAKEEMTDFPCANYPFLSESGVRLDVGYQIGYSWGHQLKAKFDGSRIVSISGKKPWWDLLWKQFEKWEQVPKIVDSKSWTEMVDEDDLMESRGYKKQQRNKRPEEQIKVKLELPV